MDYVLITKITSLLVGDEMNSNIVTPYCLPIKSFAVVGEYRRIVAVVRACKTR